MAHRIKKRTSKFESHVSESENKHKSYHNSNNNARNSRRNVNEKNRRIFLDVMYELCAFECECICVDYELIVRNNKNNEISDYSLFIYICTSGVQMNVIVVQQAVDIATETALATNTECEMGQK